MPNRSGKRGSSPEEKRQKQLIAALAGTLLLGYWWFFGGSWSATQVCHDRLENAQRITMSYMAHHRKVPGSLTVINEAVKKNGKSLPLMIPEGCRPIPNAIMYSFDGSRYTFKATMANGNPLMQDGKEVTMTVP